MPGLAVQAGATVICGHATGRAVPNVLNERVMLGGRSAVGLDAPWTVAGCTNPPVSGGPCVSAIWVAGSMRVTSIGMPFVIQGGTAICAPTPSPLRVTQVQSRVKFT
jgi:hypothetical protein